MMQLFIRGLLEARAGQRCLAALLELVAPWLPGGHETPCANTGRMWLLRLGLYELTRPKPKADDWVLIFDHTVQLGGMKALVIVGIRLSQWEKQRGPLQHEDLTVLDVMPMRHSSGAAVKARLEVVAQQIGDPRAILSDGGSDLKCAIASFQKDPPRRRSAVRHQAQDGIVAAAAIGKRSPLGKVHHSREPNPFLGPVDGLGFPDSSRLEGQVSLLEPSPAGRVGSKHVEILGSSSRPARQAGRSESPGGKTGLVAGLSRGVVPLVGLAGDCRDGRNHVRHEGYHTAAADQLRERLDGLGINAAARTMETATLEFVAEQSAQARPGERLIGSSEVLESLIGKYKDLQGKNSRGGMTPQVLAFGAIVMQKTTETIRRGLAAIRTCDVLQWCQRTSRAQRARPTQLCLSGTKTGYKTTASTKLVFSGPGRG